MAADVDFNSDLNPLKLGYLELLLSTDEISSMLDAEDVARLEKVRIEQLRKQEALPEFFGEKCCIAQDGWEQSLLWKTMRLRDRVVL